MYDCNTDVLNHNSEKSGGWGDREVHGNMLGENFLFNNFSDIPGIFLRSRLVRTLHIPETSGCLDYYNLAFLQTI
jgi:hypothetical protein